MKPQLISFKICPFVQRSVILLHEKRVEFDIEYINLKEPPAWFKAISPLGKVPVLKVGDEVLFESAVIMEYLDEVHPPSLHPLDPLTKARNRAWIEFSSNLLMEQFKLATAKEEEAHLQARKTLRGHLEALETQLAGPLFNGAALALVDIASAPIFMRLNLLESWLPMGLLDGLPKLAQWSEELLARQSVIDSVVPEFPDLYRGFVEMNGGYFASAMGG